MKQDNNSFYRLIISISKPLIYLLYRPKYYGKEYLDFDGPAIIASNHIHMPDPLFIMTGTARIVRYLSMIIPIALKSKGFPFINKYSINIGKPYSIMENADLEAENNRLRAIIQSLYDEI